MTDQATMTAGLRASPSSEGLAVSLRRGRAAAGLTLTQAAGLLGISRCHLHELEAGRASNPTLATLAAARRHYGISADALLDCAP